MPTAERLHAKRAATEEHVRQLEARGAAGRRYTATMPDMGFMALGLVSDVGWLLQLILSARILSSGPVAPVIAETCLVVAGVATTIYLGLVHEKEIALRWQKDASFGLVALGGIVGVGAGVALGNVGLVIAGILNAAGSLPIFFSFREGIIYNVR